jgi:hypothetical protein
MREKSSGAIAAGAAVDVLLECEAREKPVSAGFSCGNRRAYATKLITDAIGAQMTFYNPPDADATVCTGNVLCAS